jgi:hypothetical protein
MEGFMGFNKKAMAILMATHYVFFSFGMDEPKKTISSKKKSLKNLYENGIILRILNNPHRKQTFPFGNTESPIAQESEKIFRSVSIFQKKIFDEAGRTGLDKQYRKLLVTEGGKSLLKRYIIQPLHIVVAGYMQVAYGNGDCLTYTLDFCDHSLAQSNNAKFGEYASIGGTINITRYSFFCCLLDTADKLIVKDYSPEERVFAVSNIEEIKKNLKLAVKYLDLTQTLNNVEHEAQELLIKDETHKSFSEFYKKGMPALSLLLDKSQKAKKPKSKVKEGKAKTEEKES